MSINTGYQLFMKNPNAIVLLCLPENYQKEDFSEYLEGDVVYADCRTIEQADNLYDVILEASVHHKILCLDHLNSLVGKPFWESVSQMMLFMLRQEDYFCKREQRMLPLSQMRLLLPHSDSEIDDTNLEVNLLEWACRCSMMIEKKPEE